MPITVTATAGILDETAEQQILPRLSEAVLARTGLTGNAFMSALIVGSVQILPAGRVYAGGRAEQAIFIELKVPSIAFTTQDRRQGFVDDVNTILRDLTHGTYPKDKTFVNITYAVDGSWGVGTKAWTNDELETAIGTSFASAASGAML